MLRSRPIGSDLALVATARCHAGLRVQPGAAHREADGRLPAMVMSLDRLTADGGQLDDLRRERPRLGDTGTINGGAEQVC